jgi:2-oxoglutarate dehydrogenase E1 component
VNADEPDIVDRVFQLAAEFRMKFKTDVVIDVIGYRRYGHNELDQPSFTQPIMYQKVKDTQPCFVKYQKKLIEEGTVT